MVLSPEMIAKLQKLASETCWIDNEEFCIDDYAAGNQDDAYYGGSRDGEVGLAREIVADLAKGDSVTVDGERLWKLFIEEVQKDAGTKLPVENFLGSIKKHKELFQKALVRFNSKE